MLEYNFSPHSQNFEIFERKNPGVFEILEDKLKNKILVDVGAGFEDKVLGIAKKSETKKYISVDVKDFHKQENDFEKHFVGDAETVISENLPLGDEYCFCLSGLDEHSFTGDPENLASLIVQIMKPGCVVFGVNSEFISKLFLEVGLKPVFHDQNYFIFEK